MYALSAEVVRSIMLSAEPVGASEGLLSMRGQDRSNLNLLLLNGSPKKIMR
jgi:hypothetical protein